MSTKYDTNKHDYFSESADPKLRAYFGRVRVGNSEEYRTKFYDSEDLTSIVNRWMKTLEPLRTDWPTLYEFEKDLGKKVGPLSIMKPLAERLRDIDHYYEDILLPSEPISPSAIAAVKREWDVGSRLRIRGQSRTAEAMKKSTNSGTPFFTKRRSVVNDTIPLEVALNTPEVVQMLPNGNYLSCAILGWRGQEGGIDFDDVKQRVVWMFPFGINVTELQLYQVLIESAQKHNLVPAWISNEAVDQSITRLFDTKGRNDLIVCTDFSKFDQHFNSHCQDAASDIIHHIFKTDPAIENWLHDVFPIKYMIPLMYDYNKIRRGPHGMGSGSGGTNADETLTHRALQYEAAQSCKQRLNVYSQCLGDDGILSFPGIQVESVLDTYTKHGLEMNESKQYASTQDCVYLRRWHHKDYRVNDVCAGVYSTCRAIGRLAERERKYKFWSEELEVLRELSIMENVKFHPLREQFVEFCMKGSRYKLGLSLPGFFDRITEVADKATSYMPDFLGYNRTQMSEQTGIDTWWIVQYLRNL